jgi:hypothetical protein
MSPDLHLSLILYLFLLEIIRFSLDISFPLSLREEIIILVKKMRKKHHLYEIVLFKYGWIKIMAILSMRISSLPPTSISCLYD